MHEDDEGDRLTLPEPAAAEWGERVRAATVAFLDEARREHLRTTGASALKQYETLTSRARSAARTCENAREWATQVLRKLQVRAPSNSTSSAMRALADEVGSRDAEWLDMVERELGYLIAEVRLRVDARKVDRDEAPPVDGVRTFNIPSRPVPWQGAPATDDEVT